MTTQRRGVTAFTRSAGTLCLAAIVSGGCVSMDIATLLDPPFTEHRIRESRRRTANKILVIDISGMIRSRPAGKLLGAQGTTPDDVRLVLDMAERDRNIRAVILRLDTPGGEVTATDTIYHELRGFKERTGLPMTACMLGMACSGGYYVACAADRIYAQPTTVTGSIGIIARFPKLNELAEKIGYREEIITAGDLKGMAHPLLEMKPESRRIFEDMVGTFYDRFLDVILDARADFTDRAQLESIADGRIYTAPQALTHRLIDDIRYFPEVIDDAAAMAGISNAHVVMYRKGKPQDQSIYSHSRAAPAAAAGVVNVDLGALVSRDRSGFYYLWLPGEY